MKRTLLIILLISLLFSCAGNRELIIEEAPQNVFNPPDWILGSWIDETGIIVYTFTEDDVIMISWGVETRFQEDFSSSVITDTLVSDSEYSFTIELLDGDQTYRFYQGLNERLTYYLMTPDKPIGPIYFSRKSDKQVIE